MAKAVTNKAADKLERHLVQHREAFLAFVRSRIADPALAEDVLQESFAKAMKAADQLQDDENIVAWFYRILRHTIIDLYRRRAVQERALESIQLEVELPQEEAKEICKCLQTLVPTLTPQYAQLIQKVDLEEKPVETVAKELGISPNNLRVRLFRARHQLKLRLEETCKVCSTHGCLNCTCES